MRTSRIATALVATAAAAGLSLAMVGPASAATTEANFSVDIVINGNFQIVSNTVLADGGKIYDSGSVDGSGFNLSKGHVDVNLFNLNALLGKFTGDFNKGCQAGLALGDIYSQKSYGLTGGSQKYGNINGGTGQITGNITVEYPYKIGKKGNTPTKTPAQPANCGNITRIAIHADFQGTVKGL